MITHILMDREREAESLFEIQLHLSSIYADPRIMSEILDQVAVLGTDLNPI